MATIKACTDLEQSKKLAEILPIETADMCWCLATKGNPIITFNEGYNKYGDFEIPAWSLAALLNLIPDSIYENTDDFAQLEITKRSVGYHDINDRIKIGSLKDNLIDACVEMIIKLHELKNVVIMDCEKAYKEALERAKNLHKDAIDMDENIRAKQCEIIFPELKESEDERIRKEIKAFFSRIMLGGQENFLREDYDWNAWIAWIEKQGENHIVENNEMVKPAWSKEDENMLQSILDEYKSMLKEKRNWLKSLKGRYTWKPSDEQIKVCKEVYADVLSAKGFDVSAINSELNRLEEQLKNQ